jgi:DNA helicase-2/ATP-dependent DNA helicase PcrA
MSSQSLARNLEELCARVEFDPTDEQKAAITNVIGPMLIVAGPGSGKTQVLVLRCLNLILFHNVDPSRIMICTFTEKAAASLQDRIRRGLREAGAEGVVDLSSLWVGTIHSICEDLINEFIDETQLTKGYTILDELTQQLFLHEHFYQIIGNEGNLAGGHWAAIRAAIKYFAKITEDFIDLTKMSKSGDQKLESIARKFERYQEKLQETNSTDFANLQSIVLELLNNPRVATNLKKRFDYIMVDEYQDTNYIQEQLFIELCENTRNICVVGDEDQSLYRFRGATVTNFLRFPASFGDCSRIKLEDNYRSRPQIIRLINAFIGEPEWVDIKGKPLRYEKKMRPTRTGHSNGMNSAYRISKNAPQAVARLIRTIRDSGVVEDLNQIAVLLRSVTNDGPQYFSALEAEGVKYYAPRARAYFHLEEVRTMIASLLYITRFLSGEESWNPDLWQYYQECTQTIGNPSNKQLKMTLDVMRFELDNLQGSLKKGIVDLFYEIVAAPPFSRWIDDPIAARHLAIFSDLLTKFQDYYGQPVVRSEALEKLKTRLFNSFFYAIREMGLDEYEDPYDVFPSGYVQVMTIHQAKGLEFPAVIVDSLDKRSRSDTAIDRELEPFSRRKPIEPYELVGNYDHYRLFYVAFSRAVDLLILACDKKPNHRLEGTFSSLPELSTSEVSKIKELKFTKKEFLPPKPEFSITSHIHAYDICPRQYKYYREYEFTNARSGGETFGTLVHNTIEDIHLHYLKKKESKLDEDRVVWYFERNLRALTKGGVHPLALVFRRMALGQVLNYYRNNQLHFDKLVKAEEPILVERGDYVMSGIIDLIRGDKGQLQLLDFKAQEREDLSSDRLEFYKFQLAVYSKMIEQKLGERPEKTYIYLTAEADPKQALFEVPIQNTDAETAVKSFDERAHKILAKDFQVLKPPHRDVCRNCDFRHGCPDRIRFYRDLKS